MSRRRDLQRGRSTGALRRPPRGQGRMIVGVCGALAQRYGLRLGMVRLLFAVFGLVGAGEVVYLVLWLVIPSARR